MTYLYVYLLNYLPRFGQAATPSVAGGAGTDCTTKGDFFGFPKWYKYLHTVTTDKSECIPQLRDINDLWLIALAIIELLLRIAILLAIAYVLVGGVKFITARGDSNSGKINQARNTITDALVGLLFAIAATAIVSFIAGRFQES